MWNNIISVKLILGYHITWILHIWRNVTLECLDIDQIGIIGPNSNSQTIISKTNK